MKKNKAATAPRPRRGQPATVPSVLRGPGCFRRAAPQTAFCSVLTLLLASVAVLPQNATAQVRVYDAASGQSVPVPGTTPIPAAKSTSVKVVSTTTTVTTAPPMGGVRVDAPRPASSVKTLQSNKNATPENSAVTETPGAAATTPAKATAAPSSPPAATPVRVATDALGNPLPGQTSQTSSIPQKLGEVLVFVNVSEFSPIVSKRLKELLKVEGINPVFYMDERRPQEYMALLGKDFFDIANDISFSVDSGGDVAEAYGVTKANTIAYRLPSGSVRHYSLVSQMGVFLEQLNRIRQGQST